ncbi:hypothetical protein AH03_40 [Erwinia phage AH03]|uniref:Virion structural protein n=1 Tax=Erwinia phage AH03 TaxID=2869568 RepID=A0AAE8BPZ4_9CAUD|nr:hypothetical protein AH03_40 [Erwinia phage AH03]
MTDKIIYFTASEKATTAEIADIAALNAITEPYYALQVRNGRVPNVWGSLETADYVAGTIPDAYEDVPVIDPDSPPAPGLSDTQAIVSTGQVVTIGTATYTFTVVDNVITAIAVGTTA